MKGTHRLKAEGGTECNAVKIGGTTTLFGDPAIKPEKPYTIVVFPGGSVEIARTSDNQYWIHLAVKAGEGAGVSCGRIVRARMDHHGRYNDDGNKALQDAIEAADVYHVAFLVEPGKGT